MLSITGVKYYNSLDTLLKGVKMRFEVDEIK